MSDKKWRGRQWRSCTIKKRHLNFWTAMQHANDIQKFDHSVEVVIYPCRYCYGLHVARAKAKRRHKAGLDKIRLMLASPGFRAKAPQEVQEKFERLEKELTRLCEK